MLNMLIVEDNIFQCKQLINFISSSNPEIKLYKMCFSGKEALQEIKNNNIDIIFLDLKLPDISGNNIIDFIQKNNLEKYKNSIIIISSYLHLFPHLLKNPYIYATISKPINIELLNTYIKSLINEKRYLLNENIIKSQIDKELEYLHYNLSHIGSIYLRECIYLIYIHNDYISNLSKKVYPIIAKKFSVSPNNVKCNIFQATNISYFESDEEILNKYFNRYLISKPKTKDVICEILYHLTQKRVS